MLPLLFSCIFDSLVPTPSPFGPPFGHSMTCIVPDAAPLWGQLSVALPSAFPSFRFSRLPRRSIVPSVVPMLLPSMILPIYCLCSCRVNSCASWLNLFAAILRRAELFLPCAARLIQNLRHCPRSRSDNQPNRSCKCNTRSMLVCKIASTSIDSPRSRKKM